MRSALLSALLMVAAESQGLFARGDGSFGLKNPLENHGVANPTAVAAGDFNHDGKLDLAVGNPSGIYPVLQEPRDREVWKKLPSGQMTGGYFLRSADFDGDADDDLVTAPTATFLRSNGDGSFPRAIPIEGFTYPRWITVGDFDRDGRLDLAAADNTLGQLSISLGRGDGTFSPLQKILTTGRPHTVEAFDYDGDGSPDLAAGTDSGGIILLNGGGDGKFSERPGIAIPGWCYHYLVTADLNGDGLGDLVTGCATGISQGNGSFVTEALDPDTDETQVAVSDLNGDGFQDVALIRSFGVAIKAGRGDGTFGPPLILGPISSNNYRAGLLARDLDVDGNVDLVVPGFGYSPLILLWGKAGEFPGSLVGLIGFGPAKTLSLADLDVDGLVDILVPRADQPMIQTYLGSGGGWLSRGPVIDSGDIFTSLESVDLDGEGWLDLAGASYTRGMALVTLLDATGTVKGHSAMPAGSFPAAIGVGRLDKGPNADLIVPSSGQGQLAVFRGLGGGAFATAKALPSILRPKDLAPGDLDGDGIIDISVISTEELAVHFGTAGGDLSEPSRVDREQYRRYVDLAIADVSGDGLPDLATAQKNLGLVVYQGNAGRRFEARSPIGLVGAAISLAAADLNGDGLSDVITTVDTSTATGGGTVSVYLNRGAGLGPRTLYALPFLPLGHRLADLDQDGALDLVAFNLDSALILFGNAALPTRSASAGATSTATARWRSPTPSPSSPGSSSAARRPAAPTPRTPMTTAS